MHKVTVEVEFLIKDLEAFEQEYYKTDKGMADLADPDFEYHPGTAILELIAWDNPVLEALQVVVTSSVCRVPEPAGEEYETYF